VCDSERVTGNAYETKFPAVVSACECMLMEGEQILNTEEEENFNVFTLNKSYPE